jgi:hypothetical protein
MTNQSDVILCCRDCGRDYLLDAPTRAWYERKSMVLPRRCERCRAARRTAKVAKAVALTHDAVAMTRRG